MYRYNGGGRHRLTRELILRDLKEGDKGSSVLAVGMMIASIAASLLFTAIMALVSRSAGIGGRIVCGIFWVCAAVGISYTVGAILFAIPRKWLHSIFHVFVVAGSVLHFFAFYWYGI